MEENCALSVAEGLQAGRVRAPGLAHAPASLHQSLSASPGLWPGSAEQEACRTRCLSLPPPGVEGSLGTARGGQGTEDGFSGFSAAG